MAPTLTVCINEVETLIYMIIVIKKIIRKFKFVRRPEQSSLLKLHKVVMRKFSSNIDQLSRPLLCYKITNNYFIFFSFQLSNRLGHLGKENKTCFR